MKQGISIEQMVNQIQQQKNAKADYVVDTPCLEMEAVGGGVVMHLLDDKRADAVEPMNISQLTHRQIGTHLGIPASYYDRCRETYPELLVENVNTLMRREPARRMLRTLNGDARAFLSDRYRRLDNIDILEATLPVIGEMPGAQFESCEITESRMYVKILNPRVEAEVVPGDIVQAGIIISNSEVGQGSVMIQPLVYRLVCKNGMVVKEAATRKIHKGGAAKADDNYLIYEDDTLQAIDTAFLKQIRDTVRSAVDTIRFGKVVDIMREARGIPMETNDVPGFVKLASRDFKLSDEESDGVLNHLIAGKDLSLYGLSNAVTRFSQDVESYDRASELKGIGYDVLTMNPQQWMRYNNTALPAALPAAA